MSVIDFCSPQSPSLREIIPNMNVSEYIRGKFKRRITFMTLAVSVSNLTQLGLVSSGYKNKIL